jgi:hypothetical protein
MIATDTNRLAPKGHELIRELVAIPDPVFLLSPPLSLSSLVCATLGQHPQMYALPETHLLLADTVGEWWEICAGSSFSMADGLLRSVAQLYFGEQTERSVELARAWLRRRLPFATGYILELLAEQVRPRRIVEKSPSIVFHIGSMERAHRMFPQARFIHLLQHPRAHAEAVVSAIQDAKDESSQIPQWLRRLACFSADTIGELSQNHLEVDPQQAWHALNKNICEFLDSIHQDQKLSLRCEDLVAEPGSILRATAEWLGLSADAEAVEAMSHPERSPYACFGPPSARYGDNPLFLGKPVLSTRPYASQSLDGAMSWREDGEEFSPEVKQLARQFGYE